MGKGKGIFRTGQEIIHKFREEADKIASEEVSKSELNLAKKEIQGLLHQIHVQHIELEMQNDELRLSNEAAETQRHKFAGLYDLAPVGYFILDVSGVIQEVNTAGCSQLDSPRRTILNRRFQSFINPGDGELFYNFLRKINSSKTRQSCQLNIITAKGDTLFAQVEGIAIDTSGNQQQCYIALIDFTERRQAELQLKETKERLELALEASVAGTWQIDLKTEEISLDEFSCTIYGLQGCDANQTIDTFVKIIHPEDRRVASKQFGEAISHKRDLDVEYRIIRPDKSVAHIAARGHVVEDSDKSMCFVGILLDVSERKELEKIALGLKAEHHKHILNTVFQTQENERKRISEALHDSVSQLLYGIKLKLQDYKKSNKDAKVFAELNSLIELAVHETRNISFELAPSILTDFGLPTTLQEMTKRLNSNKLSIQTRIVGLKERLELHKEVSIFRIVQELVNNVIKHADATELNVEVIKENKSLKINVTDNGKGFDKSNEASAAGSGLHSIKNRLDLLNGNMAIQSGSGTSVEITFADIA